MEEIYKGFIIYSDTYFIEQSEIDETKQYEFKQPFLVEIKDSNRKSYRLTEYVGNKSVKDAIDVYIKYKDKELLRPSHSLVFDYWFDVLKNDTNSFHKYFGLGRLDRRFFDLDSCFEFWKDFGSNHEEMNKFLTDDKIQEFWHIQNENDLIKRSQSKNFDMLVI